MLIHHWFAMLRSAELDMETSRLYSLECHSTRIKKNSKQKDDEIKTEYSVHVSLDGGVLTKEVHMVSSATVVCSVYGFCNNCLLFI